MMTSGSIGAACVQALEGTITFLRKSMLMSDSVAAIPREMSFLQLSMFVEVIRGYGIDP